MQEFISNKKKVKINANILNLNFLNLKKDYNLLNKHSYNINIDNDNDNEFKVYVEFYGVLLGYGKDKFSKEGNIEQTIIELLDYFENLVKECLICKHKLEYFNDEGYAKCSKCKLSGSLLPFYRNEKLLDIQKSSNLTKFEREGAIDIYTKKYIYSLDYILELEYNSKNNSFILYGLINNEGTCIYKQNVNVRFFGLKTIPNYIINEQKYYEDSRYYNLSANIMTQVLKFSKNKSKINIYKLRYFTKLLLKSLNYHSKYYDSHKEYCELIEKKCKIYFDSLDISQFNISDTNNIKEVANNALFVSIDNFINE